MANYEEFMDPNSAIARIIAQMQGAADRSNPGPGPGMPGDLPVESAPQPGEAQPSQGGQFALEAMGVPPPIREDQMRSPQEFIQMLLGRR